MFSHVEISLFWCSISILQCHWRCKSTPLSFYLDMCFSSFKTNERCIKSYAILNLILSAYISSHAFSTEIESIHVNYLKVTWGSRKKLLEWGNEARNMMPSCELKLIDKFSLKNEQNDLLVFLSRWKSIFLIFLLKTTASWCKNIWMLSLHGPLSISVSRPHDAFIFFLYSHH